MKKKFFFSLILSLLLSGAVIGSEIDTGKSLFQDTSLGSNGKSCASCHRDGAGLENAGEYPVEMLREFMNFCIRDSLKGKMLPADDPKLVALEKYVRTFYKKK